jgi:GT2 family glycosyltransferase
MSFAVLICTYNQQNRLNKLLKSISESTLLPNKTLIIFAGEILNIENRYQNCNIEVLHSNIASQSHQKSIGIQRLINNFDHIILLDDDVLVEKKTFDQVDVAFKTLNQDYLGIALNLRLQTNKYSKFEEIFRKVFFLGENPKGKVFSNGHVSAYLNAKEAIDTQWANGISAWKNESLKLYGFSKVPIGYSAYEDVVFSFKVSKKGKIRYLPDIEVFSQDLSGPKRLTGKQFSYAAYWRLYFVSTNRLNKLLMLYSHIARSAEFILKGHDPKYLISRSLITFKIFVFLLIGCLDENKLDKKIFLPQ